MTIKEVEKVIGSENLDAFFKWMVGQTVGTNEDGSIDYYECDVDAFKIKIDGQNYDRQFDAFSFD